jgi:hypothetical protein
MPQSTNDNTGRGRGKGRGRPRKLKIKNSKANENDLTDLSSLLSSIRTNSENNNSDIASNASNSSNADTSEANTNSFWYENNNGIVAIPQHYLRRNIIVSRDNKSLSDLYNGPKLEIPTNDHLKTIYNLLCHNIIFKYQESIMNQETNNKKVVAKYATLMGFLINCSYHFSNSFPENCHIISASICKKYYTFSSKNLLYVLIQENETQNVTLYEIEPDLDKNVIKYSAMNGNSFCARDIAVAPPNISKVQEADNIINSDNINNNLNSNEDHQLLSDITMVQVANCKLDNINYYLDIYNDHWKMTVILFNNKFERDSFINILNASKC